MKRTLLVAVLLATLPVATATAVATTDVVAKLKTKGAAEIVRRQDNLTKALTRLKDSTKLKDADKTALTQQLNDELAGLTALKAKLAAETTAAGTRADVQSIVSDYRVYVLMLPKARMVAAADRLAVAEEKLTALHDKLATKAADDKALQATLTDMATHIATSKAVSSTIVTKLLAIQPADYNANHAVLANYRASLKSAHEALKVARSDAAEVVKALKDKK